MVENCRRSQSHESLYSHEVSSKSHHGLFFSSMNLPAHCQQSSYESDSCDQNYPSARDGPPPRQLLRQHHLQHLHHSSGAPYSRLSTARSLPSPPLPHHLPPHLHYGSSALPPQSSVSNAPHPSAYARSGLSSYGRMGQQIYANKTKSYDNLPSSSSMGAASSNTGLYSRTFRLQNMGGSVINPSPGSRFYNVTRSQYYLNKYRNQRASVLAKKVIHFYFLMDLLCLGRLHSKLKYIPSNVNGNFF